MFHHATLWQKTELIEKLSSKKGDKNADFKVRISANQVQFISYISP